MCGRSLEAFFDANVLYPASLRNLLMRLALTGLFRAKWSADVHEDLLHLAPSVVAEAAHEHRESLRNPAKSIQQYLETLATQGLPQTASALRELMS